MRWPSSPVERARQGPHRLDDLGDCLPGAVLAKSLLGVMGGAAPHFTFKLDVETAQKLKSLFEAVDVKRAPKEVEPVQQRKSIKDSDLPKATAKLLKKQQREADREAVRSILLARKREMLG